MRLSYPDVQKPDRITCALFHSRILHKTLHNNLFSDPSFDRWTYRLYRPSICCRRNGLCCSSSVFQSSFLTSSTERPQRPTDFQPDPFLLIRSPAAFPTTISARMTFSVRSKTTPFPSSPSVKKNLIQRIITSETLTLFSRLITTLNKLYPTLLPPKMTVKKKNMDFLTLQSILQFVLFNQREGNAIPVPIPYNVRTACNV